MDNFEEKLRGAFSKQEPQREFISYKLLQKKPMVIIRVFSQAKDRIPIMPVPYQIYEFKVDLLELRELKGQEANSFRIENYK